MPDTPEDVVKEARELLKTHWFEARSRTIVGRVLVIDKLVASLCDEVERLRTENADLVAANLSNLLGEIKSRLTPEEGEQFQSLLMSATKGWVDEITERTAVDRGLLDAFKDLPKKRKRRTN